MTTPSTHACEPGSVWHNWAGNQEVRARCIQRPQNLRILQEIVKDVTDRSGRLKPVATGLSFSDILQTDDTLVVLTDLKDDAADGALLPLERELWRDPLPNEARVRVICGARIRELNEALEQAGLGFANLGGYDGQTLIGAISTSTHGSGLRFGPLCNFVRSLDFVATGGRRYRVERTDGISDPVKFAHRYGNAMQLVQNDDWFYAAVVSLGCLGIVYSMTLAVSPAYDLVEHRRIADWSNVRRALASRAPLTAFRNYEVLINPYRRRDGDHTCLVTERDLTLPGQPHVPLPPSRLQAEKFTFLSSTQRGLLEVFNGQPRLVPTLVEVALRELVTRDEGHCDRSFGIYNIGLINLAEVLSGEYFVELNEDRFLRAIDRLLQVVADNQRYGIYQTSPISLRFVAGSSAFLSMAYGKGPFCAIEVPVLTGSTGAFEALLSCEQALYEFGARPHWGQLHELTGTPGWLESAYPGARKFKEVYRVLNQRQVFDNHFTDRLGLGEA
jgi:L-gulono-1,4-lactone dehydrogenase